MKGLEDMVKFGLRDRTHLLVFCSIKCVALDVFLMSCLVLAF